MNNFKHFVPAALQDKLKSLAQGAIELVNGIGETVIKCEDVSEIEGNHVSGWIPQQDGGFEAHAYISSNEWETICNSHREFTNDQYHECLRQFCHENGIDYDGDNTTLDSVNQEKFYEYEQAWNENNEALVQFQCFVNMPTQSTFYRSPQDIVTIRLSINFKDAPHYREKYATDLCQIIYTIDEFMALSNTDILKLVVVDKTK